MEEVLWKEPIKLGSSETKPAIEEVELLNPDVPIVFKGTAGSTKTFSLLLYGEKAGYDVFMQECASNSDFADLMGTWILGDGGKMVFNATQLTSAFKNSSNGKKTLLILDEINLVPMDTLKSINSIFDRRKWIDTPIGRLYGGENLIIAGTMNSEEDSAGNELDVALRSKVIVIEVDASKALRNTGVLDERMIKLIENSGYRISIREFEQMSVLATKMIALGESKESAVKKAKNYVLQKFDRYVRLQIEQAYKAIGGD